MNTAFLKLFVHGVLVEKELYYAVEFVTAVYCIEIHNLYMKNVPMHLSVFSIFVLLSNDSYTIFLLIPCVYV